MDVRIRITGDSGDDLAALVEWLQGENELRGRIHAARADIGETDLGSVVELLTVALGTGGAGTVLASSLRTWLLARSASGKALFTSTKTPLFPPLVSNR